MDGKDVVYDATNINYKRRIGFLNRVRALHKHDLRTVCLFMATPYEVCLERNNNRERSVPESVIQRMYFKFDVPMMAEGWDEIRIVGDEDRHDQIDTLMLRLSKLEHDNPHHEYTVGQHSMTAWQYLISHYMFGYNHSVGYCMIGYLCAYLRYYHPYEFITAYLNNANGEEDVKNGNELATLYGIRIVPPRFGLSKDKYLLNAEEKVIAKGISSVKYMNADVANEPLRAGKGRQA